MTEGSITAQDGPRCVVLIVDGKQRTYTADDDGLMWRYRTTEGWRWIGWRVLADKFEKYLEAVSRG